MKYRANEYPFSHNDTYLQLEDSFLTKSVLIFLNLFIYLLYILLIFNFNIIYLFIAFRLNVKKPTLAYR